MKLGDFNIRKDVIIILSILFLIVLSFAMYYTFFHTRLCGDYECFKAGMRDCSRVSYVNEGQEATWNYKINGNDGNNCIIDVTLLQAKQGVLGIEKLNGYSMTCSYPLGTSNYPEKDLTKCSGKLREELQTIIINKLHIYIINNLGELNQSIQNLGQ